MTSPLSRRRFLVTTGMASILVAARVRAGTLPRGAMPWQPFAGEPPIPVRPGPWQFFTYDEARAVEALVDRLVPHDELSIGGKEAGCAVFIDRQLAGFYGDARRNYMRPPFVNGTPEQGTQTDVAPAQRYRSGLAALDAYCRSTFGGKVFADLPPDQQDKVLTGMEKGEIKFPDAVDSQLFFENLLQNTVEGFFGDPLYGGNKDMVSWKMIGFPGVRYDFRDHVEKHNQPYPLPPVSMLGRANWSMKG